MMLYEIRAYQTATYDSHGESVLIRSGHGRPALDRWIESYLAAHPDGKVIVSIVDKKRVRRGGKKQKLFVQTVAGKEFKS